MMLSSSPLLLLFFFFLCSSPIPLVLPHSTVSELPGFHGALPFRMETGYVVVDEERDSQMFYYFVESGGNPAEDPLLLWLTGGPGCSVLSALTTEVGPLRFQLEEYNGSVPSLYLNPYSWTNVCSIIFLDSPLGAGFSFTKNPQGLGDTSSSQHIYIFLKKWFADHPQFVANPFYVAGDSYAGKIVPVVGQLVSQGVEANDGSLINLKGCIAGNPAVHENSARMSRFQYGYGLGLIPKELYESATKNCEGDNYVNPVNPYCARDVSVLVDILSEMVPGLVSAPACDDVTDPPHGIRLKEIISSSTGNLILGNLIPPPLWCFFYPEYLCYQWANFEPSRIALRIKKGSIGEWKRCVDAEELSYTKDIESSRDYYFNLTKRGYRLLVYSGDHDIVVPHINTQEWIRSFNLPITEEWRSWKVEGQVGGYTRTYANLLTFATVKGGDHTPPKGKPKESFEMFKRWISHKPL